MEELGGRSSSGRVSKGGRGGQRLVAHGEDKRREKGGRKKGGGRGNGDGERGGGGVIVGEVKDVARVRGPQGRAGAVEEVTSMALHAQQCPWCCRCLFHTSNASIMDSSQCMVENSDMCTDYGC